MPIIWTLNCYFWMYICSISYSIYSIFSSKLSFKSWILMWEKSCPNFGEGGGGGKLHKIQKNSSFFRESVPKIICHKSKVTFLRGMLSQIIVERVKCKHLSESIRFSDPKWKIQKVYRIYKLIEMSGTLYKYVHKNVSAATLTSSDSDFEHLEQVVSLSGNK